MGFLKETTYPSETIRSFNAAVIEIGIEECTTSFGRINVKSSLK